MHRKFVSKFHIFSDFINLEPGFQIFRFPTPKKCVLGPGDVFAGFYVRKNIDVFTILKIFYEFGLIRDIN